MKYLIAVVPVILSGCAIFEEKAAPEIADGINKYCEEVSKSVRQDMREEVNSMVKPGTSIVITCPGD